MPLLEFQPHPLIKGGHAQTLVKSALKVKLEPPSKTVLVDLPDGDRLALEVSTPDQWQRADQTVILVHGLCSSHEANHMRSLAYKLWLHGVRAVRLNLRGCGSGAGLAQQIYHSGRSEDVLTVLEILKDSTPDSQVSLVGFSLGGNIVMKLAAELGTGATKYLEQVISICAPLDLKACSHLLSRPSNWFYNWHFVRQLRQTVIQRHVQFELDKPDLPASFSLFDFDNIYTAPQSGFANADDYYTKCSAAPLMNNIRIPARVLFALDDPFIDSSVLNDQNLPANVKVFHSDSGGHVGFMGNPGQTGGVFWLDWQLLAWLIT